MRGHGRIYTRKCKKHRLAFHKTNEIIVLLSIKVYIFYEYNELMMIMAHLEFSFFFINMMIDNYLLVACGVCYSVVVAVVVGTHNKIELWITDFYTYFICLLNTNTSHF